MRDVKHPRLHRLWHRIAQPLALMKFNWDRLCWHDAVAFGLLVRAALVAGSLALLIVLFLT